MTDHEYQPIGRVKGHPRVRRPRLPRPGATSRSVGNNSPDQRRLGAGPVTHGLVEWHSMSPQERAVNWAELCNWVTWLYDRYELSVESRLPECWAEHPGMIEELWALMTWRKEIYGSEQPAGQAARYWHTELRAVTANAATYYASNCRTGHRETYARAADSLELQQRWLDADPWAGIPPRVLVTQGMAETPSAPGTMSGAAMQEALDSGEAKALSPAIREYVRLNGTWWLDSGDGRWVLVTDAAFAQKLDDSSAAMAEATAATQRRRAARVLFGDAHTDTKHGSRT